MISFAVAWIAVATNEPTIGALILFTMIVDLIIWIVIAEALSKIFSRRKPNEQ